MKFQKIMLRFDLNKLISTGDKISVGCDIVNKFEENGLNHYVLKIPKRNIILLDYLNMYQTKNSNCFNVGVKNRDKQYQAYLRIENNRLIMTQEPYFKSIEKVKFKLFSKYGGYLLEKELFMHKIKQGEFFVDEFFSRLPKSEYYIELNDKKLNCIIQNRILYFHNIQ